MSGPSRLLTLEKNTIKWFGALSMGLVFLSLVTFTLPKLIESARQLGVSTEDKPIVEIYFSEHAKLPKSYKAGRSLRFEVTMVSRESSSSVFNFEIIEAADTGSQVKVLKTGSVTLSAGGHRDFRLTVKPEVNSPRSKISFRVQRISGRTPISNLESADLEIHFWVKRR
jgi:hypothetical protein